METKIKRIAIGATIGIIGIIVIAAVLGGWFGSKDIQSNPRVLNIGLIPAEDNEEMVKKFKPTIEYLEKKLGTKVEPFVATDYSGVIEAMRSKKIDIAFLGPFSYVLAVDKADAEAFAVGVRDNGKSITRALL